jgi:hypothetical protein
VSLTDWLVCVFLLSARRVPCSASSATILRGINDRRATSAPAAFREIVCVGWLMLDPPCKPTTLVTFVSSKLCGSGFSKSGRDSGS